MDNIEIVNGVASFAECGRKHRAWHRLGQVFDTELTVAEALKACHADYTVGLQPVVALPQSLVDSMNNGEFINAALLRECLIDNKMATMRLDTNKSLGVVGDGYTIVQNKRSFEFIDMLCSGEACGRDKNPVIECCGVLGKGERVFITCKMPEDIILDSRKDDRIETYIIFTTSHDGTGAVSCMVSNIRVVCQNSLNLAFKHNSGRINFRHTASVFNKMDLLKKENAEMVYKTLGLYGEYEKYFKEKLEHLRNIKVSEKDLDNILADVLLSADAAKIFHETQNIESDGIKTRGRNIFLGVKEAMETGIGQDIMDRGSALWAINGLTTYYQNEANYSSDELKFDSIMNGNVYKKVQKAYDMIMEAA